MAFEHPSGLPAVFDRAPARPNTEAVLFREGNDFVAQAAEVNEAQSLINRRVRRIADRSMKDGDRMEGAEALVDFEEGTVRCLAGLIYVEGDIRPVGEAFLVGVPMSGEVSIGVRVTRTTVTEEQDETLLGLMPGTAGEDEPGAARSEVTIAWGFSGDGGAGELYSVYVLLNGTVITQAPPPALSGIMQQLSVYDYDALGNYIVDGCEVTALGKVTGKQLFSIGAGTANIVGYKRIRETAFSHLESEQPDLEEVAAESHTFTGPTNGSTTVAINRGPIESLTLAIVAKRATAEQRVRGSTPSGSDALGFPGAYKIEQIAQGATTFVSGVDYTLEGGAVKWLPGGNQPLGSTTYDVTYLYNTSVLGTAVFTDSTVTVSGGVNGETITLGYRSKLPRIDILGMDISGRPVYVKGIPARRGALPPIPPADILKLAEIHNDWFGTPRVDNNGTRNFTADEQRRLFRRLITVLDQFERNAASYEVLASNAVSKDGIFTDTFVDDFFRDPNEAQTAAINRGALQLAIDDVLLDVILGEPILLDWDEEVVIAQRKRTSLTLINPYDNFVVMPGALKLEPAADFWTEPRTTWTSPVTMEFTAAPNLPPGQMTFDEMVGGPRQEAAQFLRDPPGGVKISIVGFGANENLATLEFDGRDVKPAGVQTADGEGKLVVTIHIPNDVPVGRRLVRATGASQSFAEAIYVGQGVIDVAVMRRVTLVTRAAPQPVVVVNNTIINNTTNIINQLANPNSGGGSNGDSDPLAQSFRMPAPGFIAGVNFWMEAVGNPDNGIRVQLATMQNGFPTTNVLGETFISMAGVEVGDKVEARFAAPVFASALQEYCFVILTADGDHAVSISRLGDVDPVSQERISSQPYVIGEMFTSSNRRTWSTHPDADVSFEIVGAKFKQTTKTVVLGQVDLNAVSDLLVRGTVEIPTDAAGFRYEVVRANGDVIKFTPGQSHEFTEYVTETVTLRAVLTGDAAISPVLYPGTLIAGGRIRTTGTYVSRVFPLGASVEVAALFAAYLPSGASVTVDVDKADDVWSPLALGATGVLGAGWVEPKYEKPAFSAAEGRVRLTLNGGPDKRVSVAKLRAYSV